MNPINFSRRRLLGTCGGAMLWPVLPGLVVGGESATTDKRFILVILRGAMDGLAAVQPYGDPALKSWRENLLIPEEQLHRLDSFFGLHPALVRMSGFYQAAELEVFHAVASPYRERSHFDAQHVLETGLATVDPGASGWLNRCAGLLTQSGPAAMAIGQAMPKVLQGDNEVGSWSPDVLPAVASNTLQRLELLYAEDSFLGARLEQGLQADAMMAESNRRPGNARRQNLVQLAQAAATFLDQDAGPVIAVLESSGWDTHANQGAGQGQLAQRLGELDTAMDALRRGLQQRWMDTQILVVTEFGRTVAENGTGGTDHGTASAAFRLGGSQSGGQVRTDWPGLASGNLLEGRDLRPVLDMRELFRDGIRHLIGSVPDGIV